MRLAACLGVLCLALSARAAAPEGRPDVSVVETAGLRSVAGWLRKHGNPGFLGADVAEAMGIHRDAPESPLPARQRGFRNDEVLRIAQVPAEAERDYVLFMVQQPDDQVFFYFSTVREGLKRAFVSIPSRKLVAPLERQEAERNFRAELLYWEDKAATR
ncbi:MAG TPA: hypothetical protein VFC18_11660 [Burkholderiales bacterium]|nr:hypothetical protein [Burkholderiales bacterium]